MATMIPNSVDFHDSKSNGERLVFHWLSDNIVPGFAFHSLLQKNHKHKIMGEIDFLYICERGMLCIEVKGGQNIYCIDKKWYSVGKNQTEYEISNPFLQAQECMFALKRYISDTYGKDSMQSKFSMGYAVIFPECKFTGKGNDLVTEVIFDNNYKLSEFPSFLNKCFDYWDKLELDRHRRIVEKIPTDEINRVVNLLRGDFKVVPSMNLEMQHIQQRLLLLTEEQYNALDAIGLNKRIIIQGAAGTGKSILALEKLRQLVSVNKKTLYLCYNKNMAKYASLSLTNLDQKLYSVSTFHSLLQNILGKSDLFDKNFLEISNLFKEIKVDSLYMYDSIIIDEAQDLMNITVIEILEKLLIGGLKDGEWIFFLDQNQNIFTKDKEYNFALEYLNETYYPAYHLLNCNCRNTEQIARRTSVVSLVPPPKHLKISGPKVKTIKYSNSKDLCNVLRKELVSLFAGGTSPADLVILSRYKYSNSGISSLKTLNNYNVIENNDISKFNKDAINYFTVQSFKGLESNIVFYIDIDGFRKEQDRLLNYVAMSRAKVMLYVFYHDAVESEYNDVTAEGLDLL